MPRRSSSENRVIGPVKYYGRPEKRKSPVLPTQIEEPEPVPEPTPPVSPIMPPKSSRTSSNSKANSRESKARQPSKRAVKTPHNVSKPVSARGRRRNTTVTSSRSSVPSTLKKSPKKPKKAAPKAKKSPKNARKPRISTPETPDDVYTPPEDVPRRFNRKPSDPLINHDYDMEFEEVPRHLDSEDSEFQWRDPEEVPDVKIETWDPDFGDALPILEKPRLLEGAAEARQKPRLLEASKALQMTVKPEGRSKNASEARQKPRLLEEPVMKKSEEASRTRNAPEARQSTIEWQNELIPVPLPAGEILPDHVIMNSRIVNCEVKDMILANCVVEGCKFYNSKHYTV
ncbi:hypothetical protein B9Z55_003436 [Caenorhabditis nigoni]|uniref:Uncharacterized protein n=1 Tax=Caenorhabditis nigoni TaxID=1611254 RepID=A0A2G5VQF4_9PELO|nr:hypothetical protein B9Z55_003436 [Caenorhabditis nigoni]